MELKKVQEGKAELLVPDVGKPEEGEVFYRESQALSRDFSVLFYKAGGVDVLDGMAATGARSVRLALNGVRVTANDRSAKAVELVRENAELNGVGLEVTRSDFQGLCHSRRFGAVDLDPFGSPAPFVHCALQSAVHLLGVASTDTSALAGTYPRVSRRRYGVHGMRKLPNYPEVGVRALAGFVVREAAKLEVAARPVFAHAYQHYYRIYFRLRKGARRTDRLLQELGEYCGVRPLYMGSLWDGGLVGEMQSLSGEIRLAHPQSRKHLQLIAGEVDFPGPYYDVHAVCKELGKKCPAMGAVLRETGGVRTHFSPTGFRCDLPRDDVKTALARL